MPHALIRKALALIEMRREAEVATMIPTLERQKREGRSDPELVSIIKDGLVLLQGNAAEQRAALDRLERQAANPTPFAEYAPVYKWLVRHGRVAGALAAMEQRTRIGHVPYDFLRLQKEFEPLATNDRFVRILATTRAQFDDTVALLNESQTRGELPAFLQQPLQDLLRRLGLTGQRAQLAP